MLEIIQRKEVQFLYYLAFTFWNDFTHVKI